MFDSQSFFEEVKARAIAEGVNDQEGFSSLVEQMLEYKVGQGELDDDAPTESIEDQVKARWEEVKDELEAEVE